jgi:hypothetical protein
MNCYSMRLFLIRGNKNVTKMTLQYQNMIKQNSTDWCLPLTRCGNLVLRLTLRKHWGDLVLKRPCLALLGSQFSFVVDKEFRAICFFYCYGFIAHGSFLLSDISYQLLFALKFYLISPNVYLLHVQTRFLLVIPNTSPWPLALDIWWPGFFKTETMSHST